MNHVHRSILLVVLLTGTAYAVLAQTSNSAERCYSETKTLAAPVELGNVERTIQKLVDSGGSPSVAVVVVRQGAVIWDHAYGWADKENKVPATTDTVYAVGSVSKALTATALYALSAKGIVDTDRPVSRYLKSMKLQTYAGSPTVAQLISMRAGVPHRWEYAATPNLPRDEWKRHAIVAFTPGTRFVYSNIAFGVAGVIVSDVTRRPLGEAAARLVFNPLGMTHTALYSLTTQQKSFLAVGYSRRGRMPWYPIAPEGGAGFSSSARDLARLGMLHARVPDCSMPFSEALRDMHRSVGYAGGWGRIDVPNGRQAFLSNGEVLGGRADILVVPQDQTVIVVTQNTHSGSPGADELTFAIADELMPGFSAQFEAQRKRFEAGQQKLSLENLSGNWKGNLFIEGTRLPVVLKLSHGTATLQVAGNEPNTVEHLDFTTEGLQGQTSLATPVPWTQNRKASLSFTLVPNKGFMQGSVFIQTDDDRPGIGLPSYAKLQLEKGIEQ